MDTQRTGHPVEDFLKPQLDALIQKAIDAGYQRDVVVAVMIDILDDTAGEGVTLS